MAACAASASSASSGTTANAATTTNGQARIEPELGATAVTLLGSASSRRSRPARLRRTASSAVRAASRCRVDAVIGALLRDLR
ncbi:hypothetical protein [Nonomuraea sp. NPDC049758]|uniref:hypothetical protein n=1 Tax=Nonomuraea sp. NPDC049758 TaxID=3154360 RepID=UPI00343D00A3